VNLENWTVGGQFEINTRGSESLTVGRAYGRFEAAHFTDFGCAFLRSLRMKRFTRLLLKVFQITNAMTSGASTSRSGVGHLSGTFDPKPSACLLKSSLAVHQACDMVIVLAGLGLADPSSRILTALQEADVRSLSSLAALFRVVPGDDVVRARDRGCNN